MAPAPEQPGCAAQAFSAGMCPKEGAKAALLEALGIKGLMQPEAAEGLTHIGMQEPMGGRKVQPWGCVLHGGHRGAGTGCPAGWHTAEPGLPCDARGCYGNSSFSWKTRINSPCASHSRAQSALPGTQVMGCPVLGVRAVLQSAVLLSPYVQRLPARYHLGLWVSRTYFFP